MAARSEIPASAEVVDLTDLGGRDLDPLLEEEIQVWQQRFDWDFRPAADLLRRFLNVRSLMGCALRVQGEIAGYSYCVCEGKKGLLGDLYLRDAYATRPHEMQLLDGVLQILMRQGSVRRVESQLMLMRLPGGPALPLAQHAHRYDRLFMRIERASVLKLAVGKTAVPITISGWSDRQAEEAAHLLAACYRGHIDSEINDQYRSIPGARIFLSNITRYPGCGRFAPQSSVFAIDNATGRICGMSLTSNIGERSGHITQLCVLPGIRSSGVGYELLRHSLLRLCEAGCDSVSLTVTAANTEAIRLYERAGFTTKAGFPALVWDGL